MAALRKLKISPFPRISKKAVPMAIRESVRFIFKNATGRLWFVGGSALAGYYAEHRRSDDIDIFVADEISHQSTVRAIRALKTQGAQLENELMSPLFYRSDAKFHDHAFTIAAVVDQNAHAVGESALTDDGVAVASLDTLLMMKIACLVSRCSEKDLYDLDWIFKRMGTPEIEDLVSMGQRMDAGLNVETLLISLNGTALRKEACDFAIPSSGMTTDKAYQIIKRLKSRLIKNLLEYEEKSPPSEMVKELMKSAKDLKKV